MGWATKKCLYTVWKQTLYFIAFSKWWMWKLSVNKGVWKVIYIISLCSTNACKILDRTRHHRLLTSAQLTHLTQGYLPHVCISLCARVVRVCVHLCWHDSRLQRTGSSLYTSISMERWNTKPYSKEKLSPHGFHSCSVFSRFQLWVLTDICNVMHTYVIIQLRKTLWYAVY